jgi:hypothetical protein
LSSNCGADAILVGEIEVGDVTCDGVTDENDRVGADLNGDGIINIADDLDGDGVIDNTDAGLEEAVVAAADASRKELDRGGSFSQAKTKAYQAVRDRGVSPRKARTAARTGTVDAVGDEVSDGISRHVKERIVRFDPPRELGLGDTRVIEAVILRRYSAALQRESTRQGRRIDATIVVERRMQADLDGNKFTISPPEADTREWKPTSSPEWSWQITPDSSGTQILSLRIMGLINVNGMPTGTDSDSLNRKVEVTQTLRQQITGTLGASWWPAFYAILAALGGWALLGWRRYRNRHDREPQDE